MTRPSKLNISAAVKIRPFSYGDLNAVLEIQKLCVPAAAWSLNDYERLAGDPEALILVAEFEGSTPPELMGFSVACQMGEEAELWSIGVVPWHRRQGIARSLLTEVRRGLAGSGARRLFLEVRSSNTPAVELYYSVGFTLLMIRRAYYQNPSEDALVLTCKLTSPDA
jgi:[ribosomal protein S18]-alanine N-acetyltransferase